MPNPSSPAKLTATPAFLAWRLLALVYDAVIGMALLMLTSGLLLLLNQGQAIAPGSLAGYLEFLVFWLVLGVYAVSSWRFGGQTLGMRPWRLYVVDEKGHNASWKQLSLRYALASLSGGMALLWSLVDPEKRGLHDLASKTCLVRANSAKSA